MLSVFGQVHLVLCQYIHVFKIIPLLIWIYFVVVIAFWIRISISFNSNSWVSGLPRKIFPDIWYYLYLKLMCIVAIQNIFYISGQYSISINISNPSDSMIISEDFLVSWWFQGLFENTVGRKLVNNFL